jgi:hypothetical protein
LPIKNREGETVLVPYDGTRYRDAAFRLRIDVGASTQFSEEASAITLENLLGANHITFRQYLERAPEGLSEEAGADRRDRQAGRGQADSLQADGAVCGIASAGDSTAA